MQRKNRKKIKDVIIECSSRCRAIVNEGFKKCIETLKNQNKVNFNQFKPQN